ncbi:4-diphosphocytidyl-2C-methyl-D-erythritol synthase [Bordetella pertussis]|nr:4-diphosphocytidyl-2C-methyl-D-erythritol synthase [Bordetella pertussis]
MAAALADSGAAADDWILVHDAARPGLPRDALARARAAGLAVTDEASAVEAAGHAPRLVAGALRNFKVTWPDDFELMEKWL